MPCPHSAARIALNPRPPLVPARGATASVLRPAPTAMVPKTAPRARVPKTAPTAMVPWARGRWAEDENLENLEPLDHLENLENLENLDSRPPPRRRRHHRCRRRHHRRMRLRRCRGRRVEPRPRPPRRAHDGAQVGARHDAAQHGAPTTARPLRRRPFRKRPDLPKECDEEAARVGAVWEEPHATLERSPRLPTRRGRRPHGRTIESTLPGRYATVRPERRQRRMGMQPEIVHLPMGHPRRTAARQLGGLGRSTLDELDSAARAAQ